MEVLCVASTRAGQSFYLHNRVETIEEAAEHLRQLAPELAFVAQDRCASVSWRSTCSRSSPSGRAGLDDDHRVRPRHPRGERAHHRARGCPRPCPALPDPRARGAKRRPCARVPLLSRRPGADAGSAGRLATLADHTELGAGFAIAMRDLEIRGAGDLLGAEQSGHVAAVGFEPTSSCSARRSPSWPEPGAPRRARCASRRRSTPLSRRITSVERRRRSTSTGSHSRVGGRAPRAAGGCRRPLRPAPGAGRKPLCDSGGSSSPVSALTTSFTAQAHRRWPARSRLERASRSAPLRRDRRLLELEREVTLRGRVRSGGGLVDAILDLRLAACSAPCSPLRQAHPCSAMPATALAAAACEEGSDEKSVLRTPLLSCG